MREIGRVILEVLIVAVVGLGVALAANARSSRGLKISRDYFPLKPGARPTTTRSATQPEDPTQAIRDDGFTPIKYDEFLQMHTAETANKNGVFAFLDAREESHYKEGHVPLAWRIDHVNPKPMIDELRPILDSAEKVVMYCSGGSCDDSRLVAGDLRAAGIDPAKIHIYVGGITEWSEKKQPVEKGDRMSGDITNGGGQ